MNDKIDRFTLEEHIHNTWNIIDDIKLFLNHYDNLDEDSRLNVILGILSIYSLKFATLWATFEELVADGKLDLPEVREKIAANWDWTKNTMDDNNV